MSNLSGMELLRSGNAIALNRGMEISLKSLNCHDTLVFVAKAAECGIKVKILIAEAADEVGVDSVIHCLAFLSIPSS